MGPAIPFNRSSIVGNEQAYIAEAMAVGQIAGDQAFGRRCEALLRDALGDQVLRGVARGVEQQIGDLIGEDAVDLLGHGPVARP